MSIDNRIVSMQFNNSQFERGVATSMNTLQGLKKGLDMSGSTKGLESIGDATKRISFDGLSSGIDAVKLKFSALQVIAITALANISNSAINTGKQLISSLTIDPIMDGFREYETQMNAIQTIMANTSAKGTTLDEVKDSLAELNTYSDKTIYNFTEMTRNIGTFTAAGVDLKTSTAAIKGIANLAAVSGSNSQQASTAMYQLSQALASGTVKLMDWNSVVNAGMGGEVFQNALKETARAHGVAIDDMITSEGSFRETLQKGWLTSDVLTETLSKFTGDLNESQLKTMGYTDEQIKGIIKMGVTANDAATKVKTITQLMDTLKEAVGSGWAQTWQTVFGDFEEAKVLFTNVSNVIGGMIGVTSEARNEMLKGWKDLGGRTALIDSIKNAFDGVMGVVQSFTSAFRDIFPATTSVQLFSLTAGLKQLTSTFKLSDTNLENLKSTFKGIFAILDIGKTILSAVFNAAVTLFGGVGELGSSILGVTGSFGEWLVALDNTIKKSDVFNKVLQTLALVIKEGFSGVKFIFDSVVEGITKFFSIISEQINFPGFEDFHSFLELIGKRITSVGDEVGSMKGIVSTTFGAMGKAISNSKMGELLMTIWETVKMVSKGVGVLLGKMADTITDSFSDANFSGILDVIAGISIGGIALAVSKFLKSITEPLQGLQGMLDGVTGILDGVRGSFEAYQQNLKAGILLKLALSIGILAASIVAISLIDSDKLVSSLAAIGTLFTQLLVAMKLYSMIGEFKGKVIKSGVVMLMMATSILILSSAMKKLASLDWNGLAKGMVGVAALAGTLVGSAKLLSMGSGSMIKGSLGIVVFAVAIKVLASACTDLSKLGWEELTKGLIGVGVLLAEISLFLNTAKFSLKATSTAIGIVILAGAMKILASACKDFGDLSWESIAKGLVSIGLLLTEMSIFTKTTGNAKNVISTGLSLVLIASAMKILASAMQDFGNLSWESIAKGLVAMGVALLEITVAVNLMPKDMITKATGLVVMAVALKLIASALKDMGDMSWESIAKGLVAMGGSLAILAIGLKAMNGTITGSAALLVAAIALAILAPTLAMLGAMSWSNIIKGLVALAGVFVILGVAALVLAPLIPAILGLSVALLLLGISVLAIGVGLAALAIAFGLLATTTSTGATAIVAALGIIIIGVAALIPAVLEKLGEGVLAFCKVLVDGIPAISEAVITIVKAVVKCLIEVIPTITDGVFTILNSILDSLIKWAPTIAQKVVDIIIILLKVLSDNVEKFVKAGVDIVLGFIKGVSDKISTIIDAGFNLLLSFINGMTDGINKNTPKLITAMNGLTRALIKAAVDILVGSVKNFLGLGGDLINGLVSGIAGKKVNVFESIGDLMTKCKTKIKDFIGDFIEAGANVISGFVEGITSKIGAVVDAGSSLGRKALDAAKKALDSHSPSREFKKLGSFSGEGYIIGLESYNSKVADAGKNMGNNAIESMSNAISGISEIVNSNIDSQPVITPVLDLTDIQNGSKQLYSMIDKTYGYGIDGSVNSANSIANTIPNKQLLNDNVITNDNVKTKNSNIQNISKSPTTIQLVLQNGRAIAEFIVDDIDNLMGTKNKIAGRMIGG